MPRMVPRILLLENAKENAAPIVSHLEQLDWQVDFVQDGIDALVLGLTKHFDTALLDLDIMDIDPLRLVQHLHQHSASLQIIGMSHFTSVDDLQRVMNAGAAHLLAKPLSPSQLATLLPPPIRVAPSHLATSKTTFSNDQANSFR
jgi:CheY-like chemotaxis protein